jgi:hypothetical protein
MAVDINLTNVQQEPIVVSASQTAALNKYYINVASATYTDPTPTQGKGFTVFVRNGTATVGGSAYAVVGTVIYRVYHSGAWANYTHFTKDYLDTIYKATFSENTAFNKNFGTTAGTVLEGDAARYMTISFANNIFNPADSTIYYVGRNAFNSNPSTIDTEKSFKLNISGTVVAIVMQVGKTAGGVTGSNEFCTAKIKNITTAATSSSYGNFKTDVVALDSNDYNLTGATAVVAATDDITIEVTTPIWATNPTNVRFAGYILIKLT